MASSKTDTTVISRTTTSGLRAGEAKVRRSSSRSTTRAATKARPIEFRVRANTPSKLLAEVRSRLSNWLLADDDEELIDWFSTDLHKEIDARMTPGSWLRQLREAHGLTQKDLGVRLGRVSPARISDWENDRRAVSKDAAKQLSALFRISSDRFL